MSKDLNSILKQFSKDRANLVPILQQAQEVERYLSPEAISAISHYMHLSPNDIYSVASFYAQFRFEKPGKHTVKVCQGTACHVRGSNRILESVERELNLPPGSSTTKDYQFSVERVACFGSCALAPVMVMDEAVFGRATIAKAKELIAEYRDK